MVGGLGQFAVAARLTTWDQAILDQIAASRAPWLTTIMRTLSLIGAPLFAIPVGLLVATLLYRRRERRAAVCYLVTVLSGWGLNVVLKALFQRPRPSILARLTITGGFSYPSGHAMLAPLVFAFGAMLLARGASAAATRLWWAGGWAMVLSIAYSRMYLAVHYPSDVIAGLLAGTGWVGLGVAVYSPLNPDPAARNPGG